MVKIKRQEEMLAIRIVVTALLTKLETKLLMSQIEKEVIIMSTYFTADFVALPRPVDTSIY